MTVLHLFAAILLFFLATPACAQNNNWAAVACCGMGPSCSPGLARSSGLCFPRRWMSQQPKKCKYAACRYCQLYNRRFTKFVCKRASIVKNCFGGRRPGSRKKPMPPKKPMKPKPPTKKPNPPPSGGGCAFRATNGKIVIPMTSLKLTGAWTRVGNSIVWKKFGGGGIDPAGSGTICAKVIFSQSGIYYMTGTSSAPHPTEHNDAWFRFSGGLDAYRPQTKSIRRGNAGWYKGYQNMGGNRLANYLLTIDFNGHQFLTKFVTAGRTYSMCVSGRSSKYAIQKMVFVKCAGGESCSRFHPRIKSAMNNLPPSRCT